MANSIHHKKPKRTCTKSYSQYTSFKPFIREDFNQRCGYCDDLDIYNGGSRGYQIDHFKPHSIAKFNHLKTTYSNLVYSCPYCNRAKSNKWQDSEGFIDPCDNAYDIHLQRCDRGKIHFKSSQGKYIHRNLSLHLKRHELLWMIEKLQRQSNKLDELIELLGENHPKEVEILRTFRAIQQKINNYTNLFHNEL